MGLCTASYVLKYWIDAIEVFDVRSFLIVLISFVDEFDDWIPNSCFYSRVEPYCLVCPKFEMLIGTDDHNY